MDTGAERQTVQAGRKRTAGGFDPLLGFSVVALLCLGLVMVYSITIPFDKNNLRTSVDSLSRHAAHIGVGAVLMFLMAQIRMEFLQRMSKALFVLGMVALSLVLIPGIGVEVNGSMRWIGLGGVRFQPSEFVKVVAVMYCADYLARNREDLHLFKVGILNIGLALGLIGFLLIMEPDFGALVVIATTVSVMVFLAGVRFWHFMCSIGFGATLIGMIMWMEPYRVTRVLSFRDPWADPYGTGFQLTQALIAIGRGEWFGTGLGNSIQKLFYLPHADNDFMIAIIGEELGAVGIIGVLVLFCLFLVRVFAISRRAFNMNQRYSGFLAQGLGILIALQACVHVGVNTGLLPTKGLNLPLMSHGGSGMVACMGMVGMLLAIDRQSRQRSGESQ